MTLVGQNKISATTLVATAKNSATLLGLKKAGTGWDYDQSDITYDIVSDAEGRAVTYDGVGQATTLTGLNKTSA